MTMTTIRREQSASDRRYDELLDALRAALPDAAQELVIELDCNVGARMAEAVEEALDEAGRLVLAPTARFVYAAARHVRVELRDENDPIGERMTTLEQALRGVAAFAGAYVDPPARDD